MRRIGLTLAALVSASAIAACGSSSSGGSATTTGSTVPQSTAAAGDFDKTAATAQANAALLTLDDLPAGWTENSSGDSQADDAEVNASLASCLGVDALIFADDAPDKAHVESSDFESPNGGKSGSVTENVDVETSDRIASDFEVVNSPKLTDCLETVYGAFLKKKFAEDPQTKAATVGDVTAERGDIPTYGDESAGIEITVPFTIAGTNAKVVIDMIFVRVGNTAAQLLFENTFQAFDTATAADITSKAADKLTAAAA